MTTFNQGTSTHVGALSTTTLTPAADVTEATLDLAGLAGTWNISSQAGATVTVNNEVAVANTLNLDTNGGSIILTSSALSVGALGAVNVTLNGGSFTVGADLISADAISSGSLTFGSAGGTEIVGSDGSFLTLNLLTALAPVQNFSTSNDIIDDESLGWTGSTSYTITATDSDADRQVVITQGDNSFTFDVAGTALTTGTYDTLTGGPLNLSEDANGGTNITVCFTRGTRIAAKGGEVAVENIRAGDLVATMQDGKMSFESVRWVGRRRINLAAHPQPAMVAPIRIVKGAFADHMPFRDLVVSPDHAILVEGKLVAARQLLNGVTILTDPTEGEVEYYHVELDRHAILVAEGLETESYLDTGNRGFFENGDEPLRLHPNLLDEDGIPAREAQSCRPFVWKEDDVRPIWTALALRAAAMGNPAPAYHVTDDPELHLVIHGKVHHPISITKRTFSFLVPPGVSEVTIASRAASPTDARPWLEDRRRLGVYVERMRVRDEQELLELPVDSPSLAEGWWAVERESNGLRRWTNGRAKLLLRNQTCAPVFLDICLAGSDLSYCIDERETHSAAA